MPTYVDLSHTIHDSMVTYPGLPTPSLDTVLTREDSRGRFDDGVEFFIGSIDLCGNTGTYLDTPSHRYSDGWDLRDLPLSSCVDLPLVVVDGPAPGGDHEGDDETPFGFAPEHFGAISPADLFGAAVLLRTGWSRHWGSSRYLTTSHPYLTAAGTAALVAAGVVLVGIDSLNIDSTVGNDRPAHSGLLAADIPIVEHLTGLSGVPARGARFTAVPVKIAGLASFPVRAFATLPG